MEIKQLFDGRTDSGWLTNENLIHPFLKIYFLEPVVANSLMMLPRLNCYYQAPSSFKILGNEDSFKYEELGVFNDISWDSFQEKIFAFQNEKSYHYYKIVFISSPSNYIALFSLNLRKIED